MSAPIVSVVIIGRNEGTALTRCLQSVTLLRGVPGEMEIIYVDSASTDGSPLVAASFGAEVIVLDSEQPTAARGRNAGWQRARAPYVLFLDGDTVVNHQFVEKALKEIASDEGIAVVWGHRRELHPERSIYNRVMDLDWIYPPGATEFCGGDALMRRSALEQAGGYDSGLIAGEEPELCRRLRAQGYRILHIDAAMTEHDLKITRFGQYWQRAVRAGHAYAEVSGRFRGSSDPMWLRESRSNLARGPFWMALILGGIVALLYNRMLFALWFALLLVLMIRTAWKARARAPGRPWLLFLYGIHSHFQQIAIFCGQIQYFCGRKTQRASKLIEYKEGSSA